MGLWAAFDLVSFIRIPWLLDDVLSIWFGNDLHGFDDTFRVLSFIGVGRLACITWLDFSVGRRWGFSDSGLNGERAEMVMSGACIAYVLGLLGLLGRTYPFKHLRAFQEPHLSFSVEIHCLEC
jgi:hypothetical protein